MKPKVTSKLLLLAVASMDHRALVPLGDAWVTVGGMLANQRVTGRVIAYRFE